MLWSLSFQPADSFDALGKAKICTFIFLGDQLRRIRKAGIKKVAEGDENDLESSVEGSLKGDGDGVDAS